MFLLRRRRPFQRTCSSQQLDSIARRRSAAPTKKKNLTKRSMTMLAVVFLACLGFSETAQSPRQNDHHHHMMVAMTTTTTSQSFRRNQAAAAVNRHALVEIHIQVTATTLKFNDNQDWILTVDELENPAIAATFDDKILFLSWNTSSIHPRPAVGTATTALALPQQQQQDEESSAVRTLIIALWQRSLQYNKGRRVLVARHVLQLPRTTLRTAVHLQGRAHHMAAPSMSWQTWMGRLLQLLLLGFSSLVIMTSWVLWKKNNARNHHPAAGGVPYNNAADAAALLPRQEEFHQQQLADVHDEGEECFEEDEEDSEEEGIDDDEEAEEELGQDEASHAERKERNEEEEEEEEEEGEEEEDAALYVQEDEDSQVHETTSVQEEDENVDEDDSQPNDAQQNFENLHTRETTHGDQQVGNPHEFFLANLPPTQSRRRGFRPMFDDNASNASSQASSELPIPPGVERYVVRPVPAHGVTFEAEMERFNQLQLGSPQASRTGHEVVIPHTRASPAMSVLAYPNFDRPGFLSPPTATFASVSGAQAAWTSPLSWQPSGMASTPNNLNAQSDQQASNPTKLATSTIFGQTTQIPKGPPPPPSSQIRPRRPSLPGAPFAKATLLPSQEGNSCRKTQSSPPANEVALPETAATTHDNQPLKHAVAEKTQETMGPSLSVSKQSAAGSPAEKEQEHQPDDCPVVQRTGEAVSARTCSQADGAKEADTDSATLRSPTLFASKNTEAPELTEADKQVGRMDVGNEDSNAPEPPKPPATVADSSVPKSQTPLGADDTRVHSESSDSRKHAASRYLAPPTPTVDAADVAVRKSPPITETPRATAVPEETSGPTNAVGATPPNDHEGTRREVLSTNRQNESSDSLVPSDAVREHSAPPVVDCSQPSVHTKGVDAKNPREASDCDADLSDEIDANYSTEASRNEHVDQNFLAATHAKASLPAKMDENEDEQAFGNNEDNGDDNALASTQADVDLPADMDTKHDKAEFRKDEKNVVDESSHAVCQASGDFIVVTEESECKKGVTFDEELLPNVAFGPNIDQERTVEAGDVDINATNNQKKRNSDAMEPTGTDDGCAKGPVPTQRGTPHPQSLETGLGEIPRVTPPYEKPVSEIATACNSIANANEGIVDSLLTNDKAGSGASLPGEEFLEPLAGGPAERDPVVQREDEPDDGKEPKSSANLAAGESGHSGEFQETQADDSSPFTYVSTLSPDSRASSSNWSQPFPFKKQSTKPSFSEAPTPQIQDVKQSLSGKPEAAVPGQSPPTNDSFETNQFAVGDNVMEAPPHCKQPEAAVPEQDGLHRFSLDTKQSAASLNATEETGPEQVPDSAGPLPLEKKRPAVAGNAKEQHRLTHSESPPCENETANLPGTEKQPQDEQAAILPDVAFSNSLRHAMMHLDAPVWQFSSEEALKPVERKRRRKSSSKKAPFMSPKSSTMSGHGVKRKLIDLTDFKTPPLTEPGTKHKRRASNSKPRDDAQRDPRSNDQQGRQVEDPATSWLEKKKPVRNATFARRKLPSEAKPTKRAPSPS